MTTTADGVSSKLVQPAIYRGAVTPTSADVGDLWEDTSTNPPTLRQCTAAPNTFAAVSAGGSAYNPASVAITGGTIDGAPVGGTTPAAGTFTTLIGGGGSANYGQLTGGATTKAVEFKSLGSDTNVGLAIRSQGTGAIDLATGSSGVNISNGGTVTAITGTANGSYTTVPTITISPPTTAGGTQATGTVAMQALNAIIVSGGSGYAVNDTITFVGGTFTTAVTLTVLTVSGSAVATVSVTNGGTYTVLPSNPISTTSSGAGTGATFNTTSWGVRTTAYTITNAGSGYVEQPTVTFSSGSATAYATVGSGSIIRSLGTTGTASLDFQTPASISNGVPAFRIRDTIANSYAMTYGATDTAVLVAQGSANAVLTLAANGTQSVRIGTNGASTVEQLRVAHTASAVNYVQVTGAATGGAPAISAQGSDSSISMTFQAKGVSGILAFGNIGGGNNHAFKISTGTAVNTGNAIQVTGSVAGAGPTISAVSNVSGTDANIDINLTPKGTGVLSFGTYTASALLAVAGYITIKDSGGTTRRLLVG